MTKAQIEIMGFLVIILVLIIGGLSYLTFTLTNTAPGELTEAEQAYLETFTTVFTATNACHDHSVTLADVAAATLYSRSTPCDNGNPASLLETAVNDTILEETLDYQFGTNAYNIRITASNTTGNISYRDCPPLSQSNRRAETQPVYTQYGTIRTTLILCTG